MKKLLIFLLIFSLITFISCGEDDATSVTEEKAVCGNGLVEDGEECDPIVDQDCSDECEWTEDEILQGSHIEDLNAPIPPNYAANSMCSGSDERGKIYINVCALRVLENGNGKAASFVEGQIKGLQSRFDYLNAKIEFKLIQNIAVPATDIKYSHPMTSNELKSFYTWMKGELANKGCDLYAGFTNSLFVRHNDLPRYFDVNSCTVGTTTGCENVNPNSTAEYKCYNPGNRKYICAPFGSNAAGFSTLPWSNSPSRHAVVFRKATSSTMAHEFGHLLGLSHTFKEDYCSDTAPDGYSVSESNRCKSLGKINYSGAGNCDDFARCTNGFTVRNNTMSYYGCKSTLSDENFTQQQINRMRCYIDKMDIGYRDNSACYPQDKNFCDGKEEKEKNCGSNKVCYDHRCISKESLATNSKHWEWYKSQARNQFSFGEEIEFYKVKTIGAIKSNFKESAGSVKAVIDGQYSSSEFVKRVFNEALTPGSGEFKLTCGDDPASWKSSCEFKLNKNGKSKTKPRINDVIIWKSANYGKGHLAVVTSVTNDGVFVTQQNLTHSKEDKDMQLNLRYEEINGQLVYTIETDRNFGCEQPEGWLRLKSEECTKFKDSGLGIDNANCETCTDDKRAINIGDTICGTGNRYTLEVVQGVGDDSACKYFKIKDDCEKKGESCRMSGGEASCMPVGSLGNGGGCNNMSSTDNSYFALFFILFLLSIVVRRKKLN